MANQGGILQKVQSLPDKLKKAFLTQFAQWAQQNGLDIQQLQSNPQALEEAMTAFVQAMQGGQQPALQQPVAARLGAKLNYIRNIKGECPEGQVVEYFKQGGLVCKKCVEKGAAGAKAKDKGMNAVKEFKKKKACGGSKMKFELGGVPQKPKKEEPKKVEQLKRLDPRTTKTLPGGKYPSYWTSKERQTWERLHGDNDEGAASTENKGIGKNKCGGKAKKHMLGGIIGFQQGGSFKDAWNAARKNKLRYFNWTDAKGVTRMYNSKSAGNDVEYNSFRDNMNEASAQLPTDRSPKHLGWERNNPLSNEMRGKDREIRQQGTESVLPGITVIGTRRQKPQPKKQPQYKVRYNVPMGAIEYVGRDGKQYWMRQDHSTGQYYYIDRNRPISYARTAVPEGYIIPGANLKIGKGTNIGKLALGLEKAWM